MNKAVLFIALAAYVSAEPIRLAKVRSEIPIDYCADGTADYLPSIVVDVDPYPVVVQTGNTVTISASVELAKALEVGSSLEVKLVKKGLIDITIPCTDLGTGMSVGSCTYDGSELLQLLQICPDHCPDGQVSDLPLNPGTYGGSPLILVIPDIPEIIAPFVKGKIEVTAKVNDAAGNVATCITTTIQLD